MTRLDPLPPLGTEDEEWRIDGLCRDHPDPDPIWIPNDQRDTGLGVAICNTCPVKVRCGEYAMTRREPHGTWGGITEWERHFLLTGRHKRPPRPSSLSAR